jgi:hypothetical protein
MPRSRVRCKKCGAVTFYRPRRTAPLVNPHLAHRHPIDWREVMALIILTNLMTMLTVWYMLT